MSDKKASILDEAAEIAMGGWHSVEKARAFACAVTDYLASPAGAAVEPVAALTPEDEGNEDYRLGWNDCLNVIQAGAPNPAAEPSDALDSAARRVFNVMGHDHQIEWDDCTSAQKEFYVCVARAALSQSVQPQAEPRVTSAMVEHQERAISEAEAISGRLGAVRNRLDHLTAPGAAIAAREQEPPDSLLRAIRKLPMVRAREIDGEESDGTPISWRDRPFVSLTQLERLLTERASLASREEAPAASGQSAGIIGADPYGY